MRVFYDEGLREGDFLVVTVLTLDSIAILTPELYQKVYRFMIGSLVYSQRMF